MVKTVATLTVFWLHFCGPANMLDPNTPTCGDKQSPRVSKLVKESAKKDAAAGCESLTGSDKTSGCLNISAGSRGFVRAS